MKTLSTIVFCAVVLAVGSIALADDQPVAQINAVGQAKKQAGFIADFAKAAASGDTAKLLELTWSSARESSGDKVYTDYFRDTIIPYFNGAAVVDSYESVSAIVMGDPQKTPALVHFGYVRDAVGARKPFEMVVVSSDKGPFLANIIVGRCRKGHHPIC